MTATKPIKSNRKIFIWGLVAMLVIASIITTVVLVEKNSAAANGQTANGRESNGSDPNRSNNGGEGNINCLVIPYIESLKLTYLF